MIATIIKKKKKNRIRELGTVALNNRLNLPPLSSSDRSNSSPLLLNPSLKCSMQWPAGFARFLLLLLLLESRFVHHTVPRIHPVFVCTYIPTRSK